MRSPGLLLARMLGVLLLVCLAGASCGGRGAVDYVPTNPAPRALAQRAPEAVEIVQADALARRAHVEIGLLHSLHAAGTPPETMRQALRARAAAAGCDAVVILGESHWRYRLEESEQVLSERRRRGYRAVCIVYR